MITATKRRTHSQLSTRGFIKQIATYLHVYALEKSVSKVEIDPLQPT
jgi:hypothetical protein